MKLLVTAGCDITMTPEVLRAVTSSYSMEVMKFLVARDHSIETIQVALETAANDLNLGLMKLLLARGYNIKITEAVLLGLIRRLIHNSVTGGINRLRIFQNSATKNSVAEKIVKLLLETKDYDIEVTQTVLVKVAMSRHQNLMKLLLDRGQDIKITETILRGAIRNQTHLFVCNHIVFGRLRP
ncbi:hypothetical protein BDD12DRAFT_946664 [Trichophaea hybrida]|nr:hypothetical protein BDD12DRAFT_946664 [Trichophaea hybrida]